MLLSTRVSTISSYTFYILHFGVVILHVCFHVYLRLSPVWISVNFKSNVILFWGVLSDRVQTVISPVPSASGRTVPLALIIVEAQAGNAGA